LFSRTAFSCLVLASLAFATPAAAGNGYKLQVAGTVLSCTSWQGQPVRVITNASLDTLGRASFNNQGAPIIELHPGALQSYSRFVQLWWFAHECAHHQLPPRLNSENRADCLAARTVRPIALGTLEEARLIRQELGTLVGSELGHLRGEERARLVLKCAGLSTVA
jgi:hypothetical protein